MNAMPAATAAVATTARPPSAAVAMLRWCCLALLVALIAHGLLWELLWSPTGRGTLALKVLPLALALPGLLRHRLYTYRWMSLLVWLYVLEGLVRATSEGGLPAALAAIEVALAVALFGAVTLYIRRRLADGVVTAETAP